MPYLRVRGSDMLAMYPTGLLVIHHKGIIYDLESPLTSDQVDYLSKDDDGNLCVSLKDGSNLVLPPKSKEEAAKYHAEHRSKLRTLRRKDAKKMLKHARALHKVATNLVEMEKALDAQAKEIAGEYYECFHVVSYELHGTNQRQMECDGLILTPDFASVLKTANDTINSLEPVVNAPDTPRLPYESGSE